MSDYDAEVQSADGGACRGHNGHSQDPTFLTDCITMTMHPCYMAFSAEDRYLDHKDHNPKVTAVSLVGVGGAHRHVGL